MVQKHLQGQTVWLPLYSDRDLVSKVTVVVTIVIVTVSEKTLNVSRLDPLKNRV